MADKKDNTLTYSDAVKKAALAEKKGYSFKLGADYLVIYTDKGAAEFVVEPEVKVKKVSKK